MSLISRVMLAESNLIISSSVYTRNSNYISWNIFVSSYVVVRIRGCSVEVLLVLLQFLHDCGKAIFATLQRRGSIIELPINEGESVLRIASNIPRLRYRSHIEGVCLEVMMIVFDRECGLWK